jgi:hypothetical protein
VEYIPAATGNSAATVTTPTLPKPFSKSSGGASWNVMQAVRVPMKKSHEGNLSHASRANSPATIVTMIHA